MKQIVPNWTTADNQVIPFTDITHQHWSNIYWYHMVFQRMPRFSNNNMVKTVELARDQIDKKFGGKILAWKPIFDFEAVWLNKLNMLVKNKSIKDYNGRKIGTIKHPLRKTIGIA